MQHIQKQGLEEAVDRPAAARLEIFTRAEDPRLDLQETAALGKEAEPGVETPGVRGPVQQPLIQVREGVRAKFRAVLDREHNLKTIRGALVQGVGEGGQTARVRFAVQQVTIN